MSAPDLSLGIGDLAEHVYFLVGAWKDFGYEVPPAPDCKAVPPLGERSANAVKSGHEAVRTIDQLTRQLCQLRGQLVGELRRDEDLRAARVDAMLAERQRERAGVDGAQGEGLLPVVCTRVIMTSDGPRRCRLPVDHEPDAACPGNPHARPASAGDR